jgi:Ca2+-binding EF-hand superfamily protein
MTFRLAAGAAFVALAVAAAPAVAQTRTGADALKSINKDGDQTLEMAEIIDAGVKTFQAINPDGDTTLEDDETKGRITEKDWARANTDGDETLEMDEWLKILRQRVKRADKDKDGKLTAEELDSKAGQGVLVMIMK